MLKRIVAISIFCIVCSNCRLAVAAESEEVTFPCGPLQFKIASLRNTKGQVCAAIYLTKNAFLKLERAIWKSCSVVGTKTEIEFKALVPCGEMAIGAFHDEDSNGKVTTNFVGIPKEGLGTSNNPRSRFGPPSFSDAKFLFQQNKTGVMNIDIQYL